MRDKKGLFARKKKGGASRSIELATLSSGYAYILAELELSKTWLVNLERVVAIKTSMLLEVITFDLDYSK